MRLRSGVQGHGKQAASVIIVFSRSKLTISWTTSTLTQARMFVGNNPDQQMMHAHYNFKAPLKFHTTKQGQTLIFFCGSNFFMDVLMRPRKEEDHNSWFLLQSDFLAVFLPFELWSSDALLLIWNWFWQEEENVSRPVKEVSSACWHTEIITFLSFHPI